MGPNGDLIRDCTLSCCLQSSLLKIKDAFDFVKPNTQHRFFFFSSGKMLLIDFQSVPEQ